MGVTNLIQLFDLCLVAKGKKYKNQGKKNYVNKWKNIESIFYYITSHIFSAK